MITGAATAVLVFSVGNAVTAETDALSARRTNVLLSGLIGIWGQLNTVRVSVPFTIAGTCYAELVRSIVVRVDHGCLKVATQVLGSSAQACWQA